MSELVYLNGDVVARDEAKISIEDRGFNFAEGLYEVVRIVGGNGHRIESHLDRLERGAEELAIDLPISRDEVRENILAIAERNGVSEGIAYLQLTRGAAPRSHAPPAGMTPTLLMLSRPFPGPAEEQVKAGIAAITVADLRWGYCEVKTTGLLPNILAFKRAQQQDAQEAIMVRDGFVTEASRSSVFCVRGDVVYTHPIDNLLPGITREFIISDMRADGFTVEEEKVAIDEFRSADEIFLTGTATEVLPVVELDGQAVGSGKPGRLTKAARKLYLNGVAATRKGAAP